MRSRRGQTPTRTATGATALIALIAIFIVLYVLFLPADIRQDLLEDNETDDNGNNDDDSDFDDRIILRESPGRLDVLDIKECISGECEHEIPSFTLFKTTDSTVIEELNPFIVKNNLVTKSFRTFDFELLNLEHTENILLSFTTPTNEGVLTILLNGNPVYAKDIDSFNPDPIELPSKFLARSNRVEFSVSDVGWKFWKTNEYHIESIRIIGDITDVSRQKSQNIFYVSESEYYNIERGKLKFNPNCNPTRTGMLEIILNMRQLYSGVPDCDQLNVIEFPPDYIEKGENTLTFRTEDGSYLIDLIEVRTDLGEVIYPIYYFDIDEDELEEIRQRDANLTVWFEFVEDRRYEDPYSELDSDLEHRLIMTLNGHKRYINTYEEITNKTIPYDYLREDDNWIKLEPRGRPIEVSEMTVVFTPED